MKSGRDKTVANRRQATRSAGGWALLLGVALLLGASAGGAREIWVGSAQVDITPDRPVALAGNFTTRISREHATPIVAVALAIDSREGGTTRDRLLLVTCDLVAIRDGVQQEFRRRLARELPALDMRKTLLTATHTHTAPITTELRTGWYLYEVPAGQGIMHPDEFMEFLYGRLVQVAVAAWRDLEPAGVSWTLGHDRIFHRTVAFDDGTQAFYLLSSDLCSL